MQKDVIINVNGVSSKSEVQLDNNRPTGEHKEITRAEEEKSSERTDRGQSE
tara:strand:+ start:243 stop:395 length:153 start_codon:yes stop_codon:yes gene_type:complete